MYIIKQLPEDFVVKEQSLIEPKPIGRYTYFLLKKRNYTTEAAIQRLSKHYKLPRRFFGFAGNKDKRAVTEQYCSVNGNIKNLQIREISVAVVGKGSQPISLGELKANRFEIVVRNISSQPQKITRFVNYFDSQRFGARNNNHLIGKLILKRDFKAAVGEIIENKTELIQHLKDHPNDYIGVIRLMPRKILKMYINAYQSHLWNTAVAEYLATKKRIENIEFPLVGFGTEFDDKVIEGITLILLKQDGLTQRDFAIREIPELSSEGNTRKIFTDVSELSIGKLEPDELNKDQKKILVKFTLGKGSYATIVIKEMFSVLCNNHPLTTGHTS